MKYASIKVLVLVLASGGLIAACASGTDSIDFGTGASGGGGESMATSTGATSGGGNGGNGGSDGSGGSSGTTTGSSSVDAGPTCIPKCNVDADCQNSCPVAQTGINCCDTDTGLCYVASTPMCPMPQTDGGVVMPPY